MGGGVGGFLCLGLCGGVWCRPCTVVVVGSNSLCSFEIMFSGSAAEGGMRSGR